MFKKLSLIYLTVVLVLGIIATSEMAIQKLSSDDSGFFEYLAYAQEGQEAEAKEEKPEPGIKGLVTQEVVGELICFSPIKNPRFVTIAVKGADYDACFEMGKNVKVEHKSSLDELEEGQTIGITYDEITEVTKKGEEQTSRVAKKIRFISPIPQGKEVRKMPPKNIKKPGPKKFISLE